MDSLIPPYLRFPRRLFCTAFESLLPPAGSQVFVNISLTVNNAVSPSRRGELNGVAMAVSSLSKGAAPFICSPIFAWSIDHHRPFPFNFHLIYILLGLGMLGAAIMAWDVVTVDHQGNDKSVVSYEKGYVTTETDLDDTEEARCAPSKGQDTNPVHRKPERSNEKQGLILAGQNTGAYDAT